MDKFTPARPVCAGRAPSFCRGAKLAAIASCPSCVDGRAVKSEGAADGQGAADVTGAAASASDVSGSSDGACGFERTFRYATAAFDRRLVGKEFGGYRLERVLGQGRFGTGFLARPMRGGHDVFMKLVKRRGGVMRGRVDMSAVWAECAALSLCDHPDIPQWLGIVNERGRYFVIESLMSGYSLASWLAEGRAFSREEIASIGLALIDIAEHTASRGVVHNDIRPVNVLIDEKPCGFVKSLGQERGGGELAPRASSRHDMVFGLDAAELKDAAGGARFLAASAAREAQARMRVSLVDFGLAEFYDRTLPLGRRMAACAPDMAGIAEVVIALLYSNRMNIRASVARNVPWFDALMLTSEQRGVLEDMFLGRVESFGAARAYFVNAFGVGCPAGLRS